MGTVVNSTGRLRLQPIKGSLYRSEINLDIDLSREDGVLVLGDLRRLAEAKTQEGHHEAAHRLWSVVAEAAVRAEDENLMTRALAMADGAMTDARRQQREHRSFDSPDRRRGVSYDYAALAKDRKAGMRQVDVAEKWGCSPGTVARACRYVNEREDLLVLAPEVLDRIHDGIPVADLAKTYDVATKVMRWIVSDYWDRRT